MIEERFEKDAMEFENNYTSYEVVKRTNRTEYTRKTCNVTIQEAYIAGAICGYNKANEWHKDLPKEDVSLAIIEVEDCGYLLCEYRKGVWYDNGSSSVCKDWITRNIKRWKEIVLPKEG